MPKQPEPPVTRKEALEANPGEDPEETKRQLGANAARDDHRLRNVLGWGALVALVVQFVLADVFFYLYAHNRGWGKIPSGAISAWLGATVIQIVVIVRVMAEYLFPKGSAPLGVRPPGAED